MIHLSEQTMVTAGSPIRPIGEMPNLICHVQGCSSAGRRRRPVIRPSAEQDSNALRRHKRDISRNDQESEKLNFYSKLILYVPSKLIELR